MALTNFQYVTLVAAGGTPVRLANQVGANLPTTGEGSLVFSDGATLTNVTIVGIVHPSPLGIVPAGTVDAPGLYFGSADRGLYSRGTGDISFASNGARNASVVVGATELLFQNTGTEIKLFSDTLNETVIQGYEVTATSTRQLTLQKYGSNVVVGSNSAAQAGGVAANGNLLFSSSSVAVAVGTGVPTLSAAYGSLYLRNDTTALPYFNTSNSTTWQQLVGLTATQTLTGKTISTDTNTMTGTGASATTFLRGDNTWAAVGSTGVSIAVGTTPVTGGTTTRILYDNAGILGEYTISGNGTVVAMQTSPSLITPALGVATATSVAIGGATLGGNAFAVTGTADFNSAVNIDGATTLASALTYGGVTLANSVQGTGSMVLSASPTFTGTAAFASATVSTLITGPGTLSNLVIRRQVFTGSGTYTPHASMVYAIAETWGAGGGGGGTATAGASAFSAAASGGAGSYSSAVISRAAALPNLAVTIGTAGTAGTAGNNAGGAGGDTSVGALCIGKGGSGGSGSDGTTTRVIGGAGGVAGTGSVTGVGQRGGGSIFTAAILPVMGGSSSVGSGGQTAGSGAGPVTGGAAAGFASGGGGGTSFNATGTAAGGAGTAGYVVITEYCTA